MRFVPVKTLEQQAVLAQHRIRQGFIEERTASINRIRGVLAEFGQVLPQRSSELRRGLAGCLEHLPTRVAAALEDLLSHVHRLDERIGAYDRELRQHARCEPNAQRIQQLGGIGPISASALVASVGTATEFRNGRQFAAWLGLTPRQYSSGGKTRLGHITRRGDPYLRTLLIMGARAVLQSATRHTDRLSPPRMRASYGCCSLEARRCAWLEHPLSRTAKGQRSNRSDRRSQNLINTRALEAD